MYDPARDSWKSDEEQNEEDGALGQVSSSLPDKELDSDESKQPEPAHDNNVNGNDISTEDNETIPLQTISSDTGKASPSTAQSPGPEEVNEHEDSSRKRVQREESISPQKENAAAEEEVKENVQSTAHKIPSETSLPERPQEPARKIRKPNSRVSQEDRDTQAREHRERIERTERRAEGIEGGPNLHGEISVVRQHYNQRPDQGIQRRQQSPIIKLRSFNNWIKFVLINKYSRRNYTVLDLGCGKGGDIFKWGRTGCSGFIGIDIAEVSISQAKERYDKVRNKKFWADFCVGDAFGERVESIVHPDAFPVDIVSSQFCLHYAFENEQRVRTLLSNISRSLRRGGVFIGTIPNSDVINKHIRKLEPHELKWGNSIYHVEFELAPPRDGVFKPPFGHKYTFFLEDAVGNVPEYVVPFEAFRALAEEYQLELEFKKPFLRLFDEELENNSWTLKTAESMGVVKTDGSLGIEGDEREACGFYLAFAFRKTED